MSLPPSLRYGAGAPTYDGIRVMDSTGNEEGTDGELDGSSTLRYALTEMKQAPKVPAEESQLPTGVSPVNCSFLEWPLRHFLAVKPLLLIK